jgi:hypothetical protein
VANKPSTKGIKSTTCCQVIALELFGRTNSKDRRVGGAAVDGGRYTHGPIRSQQTLSKKIHSALFVQKSPQFSRNFGEQSFQSTPQNSFYFGIADHINFFPSILAMSPWISLQSRPQNGQILELGTSVFVS